MFMRYSSMQPPLAFARNIHPGEILREEFLYELDMTPYALARRLNVARPGVENIVREKRAISAEMALRLARFFGTTPEFWLNLQRRYDLRKAEEEVGDHIAEISAFKPAHG